jgi:hypothetical protein
VDRIRPIPRGGIVLRVELAELGPVRIRLMPGAKAGPPTVEVDLRDALPSAESGERAQLLRTVASALRAAQSGSSVAAGRWSLAVRTSDSLAVAPPMRSDAASAVTPASAGDPPPARDDREPGAPREPGALESTAARPVATAAGGDPGTPGSRDDDAADPDGRQSGHPDDPERDSGRERPDAQSRSRDRSESEPADDDATATTAASDLTARWRRAAAGHPPVQSRHAP